MSEILRVIRERNLNKHQFRVIMKGPVMKHIFNQRDGWQKGRNAIVQTSLFLRTDGGSTVHLTHCFDDVDRSVFLSVTHTHTQKSCCTTVCVLSFCVSLVGSLLPPVCCYGNCTLRPEKVLFTVILSLLSSLSLRCLQNIYWIGNYSKKL